MPTTIITKYGSGAPTALDVVRGELAVDTENGRLYTENIAGSVVEIGTNPAANVTFGDNVKAVFGASSDLQIYHDGFGSYIKEEGAGSLFVQSNGVGIILEHTDGTNLLFADAGNQAVTLYNGGSAKLATTSTGIDVTGTVTADGLTVASASSGVNTTLGSNAVGLDFSVGHTGNGTGTINLYPKSSPSTQSDSLSLQLGGTTFFKIEDGGDISFYEDTGTTAKLFWDASAESLGIGTDSPSFLLHAYETPGNGAYSATTNMEATARFHSVEATTGSYTAIQLAANNANSALGWWSIGTVSTSTNYDNHLVFQTRTGASTYAERMRIDSSGNLLVGKTSSDIDTNGFEAASNGITRITRTSATANTNPALIINRKSSDGPIVDFRKDGSPVGSIGVINSDNLRIGGSVADHAGLQFALHEIVPMEANVDSNGTISLGSANSRFKDLYLSGGVVFPDASSSGTSSSNTLDSYEEGTFSPTLYGASSAGTTTYATVTGNYTKVGNRCTVNFVCNVTATTGTGSLRLGGLPFTSSGENTTAIMINNLNWGGGTYLMAYVGDNNTFARVYYVGDDNTWQQQQITNEAQHFIFTLTYQTA